MLRVVSLLLLANATAIVVAAPAPKGSPRPSVAALRAAIGKSHLGKEVRVIGRQLGEAPVIKYSMWGDELDSEREDPAFDLIWKSKGIDMSFFKGNVTAVFLYNEGADDHKRYGGELPEGLSFDDDRA